MWEIWAKQLLPKALKSCPKSKKSPNLVTLSVISFSIYFTISDLIKAMIIDREKALWWAGDVTWLSCVDCSMWSVWPDVHMDKSDPIFPQSCPIISFYLKSRSNWDNLVTKLFFQMGQPGLFVFFVLFKHKFCRKTVGVSGIRTRIVRVEGEPLDHHHGQVRKFVAKNLS